HAVPQPNRHQRGGVVLASAVKAQHDRVAELELGLVWDRSVDVDTVPLGLTEHGVLGLNDAVVPHASLLSLADGCVTEVLGGRLLPANPWVTIAGAHLDNVDAPLRGERGVRVSFKGVVEDLRVPAEA